MLTGALPPTSNKADWIEALELIDSDSGEPIDISAATEIVIELLPHGQKCSPVLSAKLSDGSIDHIETGIFQWAFTADQMGALDSSTYEVRCRITKDGIVTQLIIGTLPVLDG